MAVITSAQDTVRAIRQPLSEQALKSFGSRASSVDLQLDRATAKYLRNFQKQEENIYKKLFKKDSNLAKRLYVGVQCKYAALAAGPEAVSKYAQVYSGHLDSLTTSLKFLKTVGVTSPAINATLGQYSALQSRLNGAEAVKAFVRQRQQALKEALTNNGLLKELKGFQKQAFYYSAQIKEYKQLFEDPSKLEKKLVEMVQTSPQFKEFFASNSMLGNLFALPGRPAGSGPAALQGLQTRASMAQLLVERFGSTAQATEAMKAGVNAAQGELNALKSKAQGLSSGSTGSAGDLPQGFKPNRQKAKSFLKRLELGFNVQSRGATFLLPVTTDIGLSLGYKLSDKSILGIGLAYTMGWGKGWDNIALSSEGLGLRSFFDYKLKGSLFITGGYEMNYRTAFSSFAQLKEIDSWQRSGLVGLSKRYKVSKKLKGDVRLMWDFLSYNQIPVSQPFVFRVGYNLK